MEDKNNLVNFFVNYYNPKNSSDEAIENRKYYSSNKAKDYINYISTGIADMKKMDYVAYMKDKEKSYGLFNQDGLISSEYTKGLRERLRVTNSVIWDCLITFEEKFGKTWCNSFEQAYELLKTELPKFFKRAGLKPDNIEWFAGLHENTDNRHIHLCFFEKEPQRIRPRKKGKYFSIGKLPLPAILECKANLEFSATDYKARMRANRLLIEEHTKERLRQKSGLVLQSKLLSLAEHFPKSGHLYYHSENMASLRPEIDSITNYLIKKNFELQCAFADFKELAKEKDEKFAHYCKRNKVKQPYSFEKKYTQDIYRRIGNKVIIAALNIRDSNAKRLKLNAQIKSQKYAQKKGLFDQIVECMEISKKVDFEIMRAFQDYMEKLESIRYSQLVEQREDQAEM